MAHLAAKRMKVSQEEDIVAEEGFMHCVSPVKISKKSSKYFNYVLQTDRDTFRNGVSFSPEKHSSFQQAEERKTPIKLKNIRRVLSISGGEYDVQVTRSSSLEVRPGLDFNCRTPSQSSSLNLEQVALLHAHQKVGRIQVKVTSVQVGSEMVKVFGTDLEKKDCYVADRTGRIKLILWDRLIGQVVQGNSYAISNVTLRQIDGVLALTTTRDTTIGSIAAVEVPEHIASAVVEVHEEELVSVEGEIVGADLTDMRRCIHCHTYQKAFDPKDKFHQCEGCNLRQKAGRFLSSISGKVVVGNKSLLLTMSVLCVYLNANKLQELLSDVRLVSDHLLDGGDFKVTYTKEEVVTSLVKASVAGVSQEVEVENWDDWNEVSTDVQQPSTSSA